MKTKFTVLIALSISAVSIHAQTNDILKSPVWLTRGNYNTNPGYDFLGTKDAKDLVLRTHNIERFRITRKGYVAVDVVDPQQKLDVNGNINIVKDSGLYIGNKRVLHTDDF